MLTLYKLIDNDDCVLEITDYADGFDLELYCENISDMEISLFPALSIGILNELKNVFNGVTEYMSLTYRGLNTSITLISEDTIELTVEHEYIPKVTVTQKFNIDTVNESIDQILKQYNR